MTRAVPPPSAPERVVLVAVGGPATADADGVEWADETLLDELRALATSAGAVVVGELTQRRTSIDKTYFIGKGKAQELAHEVKAKDAEMVLFDNDLSPAQGRNIEEMVGVRVLDRSELILDIFAERARTREAKLQVELAQLQYLLPRLKRMWTHLSRIRGGIGLRGPGETQIEVDRRAIRDKIATLEEKLERIEKRRELQRKGRADAWNVALVGYTNVGKSTIMNRLSGERLTAENRLFATLDATTRQIDLPSGDGVVLTDTVGFIRNLPHHLVASFRATLEEVVHADLLLHVVDVSDPQHEEQMRVVDRVLEDLEIDEAPRLLVFNKFDRIAPGERAGVRARLLAEHPDAVVASAIEERGLVALEEALSAFVRSHEVEVHLSLPLASGKVLSRLYEMGDVLERTYTDESIEIEFRARREVVERLEDEGVTVRAAS